jgi:aspartyl-tRNA(Asn)/glutamyl-tRNA(Gln) amidotransferase subunit C
MITRDVVKKLASLSRLTLSEEEIERLPAELSAIMGYAEKLNERKLDGIKPTAHAVAVSNVFRSDDSPRSNEIIADAIRNAPEHDAEGRFFRVPKVIG